MAVIVTAPSWHIKQVERTPSTLSICLHLFQNASLPLVHVAKETTRLSPCIYLSLSFSHLIFFRLAPCPFGKASSYIVCDKHVDTK